MIVMMVVVLLSASLDASARRLRISRLGAEQFQRHGPMAGRWAGRGSAAVGYAPGDLDAVQV